MHAWLRFMLWWLYWNEIEWYYWGAKKCQYLWVFYSDHSVYSENIFPRFLEMGWERIPQFSEHSAERFSWNHSIIILSPLFWLLWVQTSPKISIFTNPAVWEIWRVKVHFFGYNQKSFFFFFFNAGTFVHSYPIAKKSNVKECSSYHTIALISHASKIILKIL